MKGIASATLFFKVLLLLTLSALSLPAHSAAFKIYVSATGSDRNNGLSKDQAVLSLYRVNKLLEAHDPASDVEVHIAPGTYYGQQVKWTYVNGHTITFTPTDFSNERPVFDGQRENTWFQLDYTQGMTGLKFRYIRVENYNTAMSFNGDRDDLGAWNGGTTVQGMYFYRIGGLYGKYGTSTAAIRLVNSRDNEIVNNHFIAIENPDSHATAIHAIYMAHYSSNNDIARNKFVGVNGDPIKVRDSSNFNSVIGNRFFDSGYYAYYVDAYCEAYRPECTKPTPECPSMGNAFRDNELHGGYYGAVKVFKYFGSSTECGVMPEPRLRTSGNYYPEPQPEPIPDPIRPPPCPPGSEFCHVIP